MNINWMIECDIYTPTVFFCSNNIMKFQGHISPEKKERVWQERNNNKTKTDKHEEYI
jgi:hypothetical protein